MPDLSSGDARLGNMNLMIGQQSVFHHAGSVRTKNYPEMLFKFKSLKQMNWGPEIECYMHNNVPTITYTIGLKEFKMKKCFLPRMCSSKISMNKFLYICSCLNSSEKYQNSDWKIGSQISWYRELQFYLLPSLHRIGKSDIKLQFNNHQ